MEEIYWITRLDAINNFLYGLQTFLFIISCITVLGGGIPSLICSLEESHDSDCKRLLPMFKKILTSGIYLSIIAIFVSLGKTFIPTTKEAFVIYGVGGTIDWVKNDSVARQIPHKTVIALDKWIESIGDKSKSNTLNNDTINNK